ncbi:hypothetical protein EGR_08355 [Echinococcus granulosus]|uniref:Uncharacterized protein n=1 Tax=Echinococcus granulosus TaxID=6210 RepID=W6UF54_ECHGR|nr:hypothetical protein EGR_08355 [Echinococcus granulosus]EUB56777.1 hypothetical protein EGR_08355 [Echinococcus granulosus]
MLYLGKQLGQSPQNLLPSYFAFRKSNVAIKYIGLIKVCMHLSTPFPNNFISKTYFCMGCLKKTFKCKFLRGQGGTVNSLDMAPYNNRALCINHHSEEN